VDRFVGRVKDLAELLALLDRSRLLSVVGPAGSGKSRLAVEVAGRAWRGYPDGVWLVELGAAARPQLVGPLVATTLGIAEQPGEDLLHTLVTQLADRSVLLVIDNCEHLLASTAALIETLLRRCPGVRVIATSREALRISGEVVYALGGLSVSVPDPESVELFLERARERRPEPAVSPTDTAVVAEICARLDGLPLAIELATRRLGLLGLTGLRDRLDDRFTVLTVGSRTAQVRHTSLRAAIDWSYDLADKRDQQVFRRLSVFADSFDIDGAAAVCADETLSAADVLESVGTLVEQSLLVRVPAIGSDTAQRFRQLQSLRLYGLDRLADAHELEQTQERLVDWLVGLAEDAQRRFIPADHRSTLDRQRENLGNALDWAIARDDDRQVALATAYARSWRRDGFTAECRELLTTVLDRHRGVPAHRSAALDELAWFAINHGEYAWAHALVVESVEIERAGNEPFTLARALSMLGHCRELLGDPAGAIRCVTEAVQIARRLNEPQFTAKCQHDLALALKHAGDLTAAARTMDEALAGIRTAGATWLLCPALHSAGEIALARDDLDTAENCFAEALRGDRTDPVNAAYNMEGMAIVAVRRAQPERAVRLAAAAAAVRTRQRSTAEPGWRQRLDRAVAAARASLGSAGSAAAAVGAGLSLAAAVADALGEPAVRTEPAAGTPDNALTQREEEVAVRVAEGLTNRQIATRLGVGERTIESHLEHIRRKLGVESRVQVALWAAGRHRVPTT
jgi:non-specific serine/threonine protein kinase